MKRREIPKTQRPATEGLRVFGLIWCGQLVSLVGSGLTGFALGVWVYQGTGSATQYALITLFSTLPGMIVSPLAGTLADRWDRRRVMILSDAGAGLSTLVVAVLLLAGRLEVWHIYLTMTASSAFSACQFPAYSASITLLVPRQHLGRASGMVQLGQAVAYIIAPALAGVLMELIRIEGVILIDFATFVLAVGSLLLVRIPRPASTEAGRAGAGSWLREAAYGWTYIRGRPGLLGLLTFFSFSNLTLSFAEVLFTPLVLSYASPAVLGRVWSVGGVGMLAGSLVMSAWGGPRRRVYGVLAPILVRGGLLVLAGLRPHAGLAAVAALGIFFSFPIVAASSQAIWQSKVAPDVQGRVFGVRHTVAFSMRPLAYVLAGPLADNVFEPLLAVGGPLAGSVGRVMGVGQGRGIGLFFVVMGMMLIPIVVVGYLNPRLRWVEDELPDAVAA